MNPINHAWAILKSNAYDGESEGDGCAICGNTHMNVVKPTGTGMMACTKPNWEDYEPGDGEGYEGHLEDYKRCQKIADNKHEDRYGIDGSEWDEDKRGRTHQVLTDFFDNDDTYDKKYPEGE